MKIKLLQKLRSRFDYTFFDNTASRMVFVWDKKKKRVVHEEWMSRVIIWMAYKKSIFLGIKVSKIIAFHKQRIRNKRFIKMQNVFLRKEKA